MTTKKTAAQRKNFAKFRLSGALTAMQTVAEGPDIEPKLKHLLRPAIKALRIVLTYWR